MEVSLPAPRYESEVSIEEALLKRRSIREYSNRILTIQEISQLLWSAQGITDPRGFRTAPSAGALYPLEVYVAVGNVEYLSKGVYIYKPEGHMLVKVIEGDKREALANATFGQT
ncbi:MAG: SagB/ThcOx family dehydrogenase [Candidatus Bathyarchaeia archaeon]